MIKNIRHIQIKRIIDTPNLYKAIIIYEEKTNEWLKKNLDENINNDEIENIKIQELNRIKEMNK
tara:strand:+ start:904 stop:1095 length:192 start_codon:yes stop_codon:yes gene_type:complete